ncbi:MAG: hypothetical protein IKS10_09555 [Lachnospiraceae bacterium]|nr:hypothetical protein [Lachnospiraceae bacterium]
MKKTLVAFLLVVLSVILAPSRTAYAADVDSLKNGDIVEFGMYPQKRVTDLDLIAELDDVAKKLESVPVS